MALQGKGRLVLSDVGCRQDEVWDVTADGSQGDAGSGGGSETCEGKDAGEADVVPGAPSAIAPSSVEQGVSDSILVFDATNRLHGWTAGAGALPGAGRCLVAGAELADLHTLFDGMVCVDRPLAGGGFLRVVGGEGPSSTGDLTGRMFAAASHDLRQPLAALSLLIGTLEGRVAADRPSRDLLRSMAQAVESMRGKVDGHFDLARLEAGLIDTDIRPQAINGVLMRLALDVAPRCTERGVRFAVIPCSAIVRTDGSLLERLIQGLVGNALRHTARGRVLLGCRPCGNHLRIEVWDTGRGLLPDQVRALREELARPGGYGQGRLDLGLTLARGLARRLELTLDVRSVDGRGTVFTVLVPRADDAEGEGGEGGADAPAPRVRTEGAPDLGGARVLLIEDDPMVLAALEALLEQWGCTVVAADSCDSALERLGLEPPGTAVQPPDLIISDLRLKGSTNGIVTIRQIAQALGHPVPGMILTGDTDPKRLREARLSGYLLLHKPVSPLALQVALSRLLDRISMKS